MTIETEVANLTTQTTALLNAVNVSKATLDQKETVATEQAAIATTKATEAATSAALALQAKNDAAATFAGATIQNGLALVTIQGEQFALLPVDANGDVIANISQRTGNLADLLQLPGAPGEIGVALDADAIVLFNGVATGGRVIRKLDSANALGADSIAIGGNSATTPLAEKALALGYQANAGQYGAVALGGAIPKIQTVHATLGGTTTDATGAPLSLDGVAENAVNLKLPAGFHDVDVVFIARQGANWARFHRRVMFRASSSAMGVLANETSPTPDVASGLVGLSVSFSQFNGGRLYFNAVGLAATTIYWSAHVTIRSHGI